MDVIEQYRQWSSFQLNNLGECQYPEFCLLPFIFCSYQLTAATQNCQTFCCIQIVAIALANQLPPPPFFSVIHTSFQSHTSNLIQLLHLPSLSTLIAMVDLCHTHFYHPFSSSAIHTIHHCNPEAVGNSKFASAILVCSVHCHLISASIQRSHIFFALLILLSIGTAILFCFVCYV